MAQTRKSFIIDRIIALEGNQHLIDLKIETKHYLLEGTKKKWEIQRKTITEEIKRLKDEFGRASRETVTGHDVDLELDKVIREAKVQYLSRMYRKIPKGSLKLIQNNSKLADIFLTEGYGSPIVRRVLKMKNPEGFLNLLKNEEVLMHLKRNPGIVRSKGFQRLLSMSERLTKNPTVLMEAMAKDAELAKLLSDPAVLKNRTFLTDLEKGIREGIFIKTKGKGAKLNMKLIKLQARAAVDASLYNRFKKLVQKNLQEATKVLKKSAVAEKLGKKIAKARHVAKTEMAIRAFQIENAYHFAAQKCNLIVDPIKKTVRAVELWQATSRSAFKLARLEKIPEPTPAQLKKIEKLKKAVQEEMKAAKNTISKNKKLEKTWQEYNELIKKAQKSGAELKAMNEAQFLKYRPLWLSAAKLGGMAFLTMLVHGFQKAENKVDYIISTPLELGTFGVGLKLGARGGAALGARIPAPGVAKIACVALGAVAGYFGSEAVGAGYDYFSKGILDRWAVNRGRGEHWEVAGNLAEVGIGVGINNVRALMDFWDVDITNIEEDELFLENENGETIPNFFYYQNYLQASEVQITTGGYKKHYFRSAHTFDREIEQLAVRMEAEAAELEKERDQLLEANNPANFDEINELEKQIDLKYNRIKTIHDQFKIRNNPGWLMMQEMYHVNLENEIEAFKTAFAEEFSEEIDEKEEVSELLDNLESRFLSNAGELIRTDREKELWIRLRDQEVTIQEEQDGETVEKTMTFKDWFLNLRRYAKSKYIFSETRDHGGLREANY